MKPKILVASLIVALLLGAGIVSYGLRYERPPTIQQRHKLQVKFNKHAYSVDAPTSLWIVVNKARALNPAEYKPGDLIVPNVPIRSSLIGDEKYVSKKMESSLEALIAGASKGGVSLNLQSGYRSYASQLALYDSYVERDGKAAADTYSARAGHSEHQTGLAVDLGGSSKPECNVADCFAGTPEAQWIAENAYEYGFILRYPAANEQITGYKAESWHLRYVGAELAQEMHKQGVQTLEEFFGLPSAPNYLQ